jgi:hypothetical protein
MTIITTIRTVAAVVVAATDRLVDRKSIPRPNA